MQTPPRPNDMKVQWTPDVVLDPLTPDACIHGDKCNYNGYCSFVHPGEHGSYRKFVAARSFENEEGRQFNVPDRVILCEPDGSPADYYERTKLRFSWAEWKVYTRGASREEMPALLRDRVRLYSFHATNAVCDILTRSLHHADLLEILYSHSKAVKCIKDADHLLDTFPRELHHTLRITP